jgi:RNA polymerase sigma factor (sigma-70 family)
MVLGVCRRFLRDPHDVEDAFQATVLVFVRKAASIRGRDRLCPWLYGVATRVALRARQRASRRHAREGSAHPVEAAADSPRGPDAEILGIIDQELGRLPEKYRVPILICLLEGRTQDEAAAELRWPLGTVRSRLFRGRELLKERLRRRGAAPSVMALEQGIDLLRSVAAPPASLVQTTVASAARSLTAPAITAAGFSVSVTSLAEGVISAMWISKLKLVAAGLLVAGSLGTGAALVAGSDEGQAGQTAGIEPKTQSTVSQRLAPDQPPPVDNTRKPDPFTGSPSSHTSPIELQIQLRQAKQRLNLAERLANRGITDQSQVENAKSDVDIISARIQSAREDLQDEIELLELQLEVRAAEVKGCVALYDWKQKDDQRMTRLATQSQVSQAEVERTHFDLLTAEAQVRVKEAEINELRLRIKQRKRRLSRFDTAAELPGQDSPKPGDPASAPPAERALR